MCSKYREGNLSGRMFKSQFDGDFCSDSFDVGGGSIDADAPGIMEFFCESGDRVRGERRESLGLESGTNKSFNCLGECKERSFGNRKRVHVYYT